MYILLSLVLLATLTTSLILRPPRQVSDYNWTASIRYGETLSQPVFTDQPCFLFELTKCSLVPPVCPNETARILTLGGGSIPFRDITKCNDEGCRMLSIDWPERQNKI